jgi:hypothetical protein
MDTGYVNLIDDATRQAVLARTHPSPQTAGVAGVCDQPGATWNHDAYAVRSADSARWRDPYLPVIRLTGQPSSAIVAAYASLGALCDRFIAFELGTMFAPFGKIYDPPPTPACLTCRSASAPSTHR